MSGVWGLLQLLLLAAILGAALTSISIAVLYPRIRPPIMRMNPSRRSLFTLLLATAPLWVPASLVFASLLPPISAQLISLSDHCLAHHDGHPHICPVHLPANAGSFEAWLLIVVIAAAAAWRLFPLLLRGAQSLRTVLRLRRSLLGQNQDVVWIDGSLPIAFTVGWMSPKTFISDAARSELSEAGLQVVLEHEREHRRRRDPLQRSLVFAATVLLPRRIQELLVGDWQLAAEQACDQAAAEECGDRFEVARTILAVERALTTSTLPGVAFGGSTVKNRVRYMLAENPHKQAAGRFRLVGSAAITILLVASPLIHHGLETVLEALLG